MEAKYDFSQGKRGAVDQASSGKTRITIRLDEDVLAWFREQVYLAGGGNYQTLINAALRQHIEHQKDPMEEIFRRVLREDVGKVGTLVPGNAASCFDAPKA